MKFSVFHPFPIYGAEHSAGWPQAPADARRPGLTAQVIDDALTYAHAVEDAGLDMISVAEHHYSATQLSPNSVSTALLIAREVTGIDIGLLGTTLPLVNPIRVAEEIGTLSALAPGRLLVGLFRGTPNEFLTYGTNPWESREVFYEQVELLRAIWREPEPFAWVGRHFDFRTVAVWPQPADAELPILVSANSPSSAAYAAANGFIAGFSFMGAPGVKALAEVFTAEAEKAGRTVGADDMLYRGFGMIAESDAQARRLQEETRFGELGKLFSVPPPIMMRLGMAMNGVPAAVPLPENPPPAPFLPGPTFSGGPETVADQITEFVRETGVGRIELTLQDQDLPLEHSLRAVRLFGEEVAPRVRANLGVLV